MWVNFFATRFLCHPHEYFSGSFIARCLASDLNRKTGLEVFVDMSVSETLYHLIVVGATQAGGGHGRDGLIAEASTLQKRLRVPDKRFWHIKIKVRAELGREIWVLTIAVRWCCSLARL